MSSKYKIQKQTKNQQKASAVAAKNKNAKNQRANQIAAASAAAAAIAKPINNTVSNYSFKPTDITIPTSIREMFPDNVALYDKLKSKEKQIDSLINKKLLDLQDYQSSQTNQLHEDPKDTAILRIFVYNTAENQPWQKESNTDPSQPSYPPSWTLRIEGKLLDEEDLKPLSETSEEGAPPAETPTSSIKPLPKFSTFLSSISIEFHAKDGNTNDLIINSVNGGPNTKIVEWHDSLQVAKDDAEREQQQFDGLDIKRGGSSIPQSLVPEGETVDPSEREITCDILIQPKFFPVKLQIIKDSLIELLGCTEITQHECFTRIFNYIKINNLFEVSTQQSQQNGQQQQQYQEGDVQKAIILKTDDLLYRIFESDRLTVPEMMDIISTKLLKPLEPIKIQTSINTLTNSTVGDIIVDLKVNPKLMNPKYPPGNTSLQEVNNILNEFMTNETTQADITKMKDNINLNLQLLNFNKLKYDFYKSLATNPIEFLEKFQKNNAEYLKVLASDSVSSTINGSSVNDDDDMVDEERVRRSEFYTNEFLSENISLLFNTGRL